MSSIKCRIICQSNEKKNILNNCLIVNMIIICFLEYECGFCCAFGIWVWVLASAPPLKGYSQKWKYENLCNAYMGATKTKSIKGHAILACLWLTKKTIITATKLTDRVSVFFSTLAILGAIYLFTLSARVAIRSCRWKFNSQFFLSLLFLCLCFSFVFFFSHF